MTESASNPSVVEDRTPFGADNPIRTNEADELGRGALADAVADALVRVDASEGAVIALFGRWGVGKTSLINLVRSRLHDDVAVLDFNPWLFSGTEQLLHAFFHEVAAQLRSRNQRRLLNVADQLEKYGDALQPLRLIPTVGGGLSLLGGAGTFVGRKVRTRVAGESLIDQRVRLESLLDSLPGRLVVVIDDVDRLSAPEVRDIFRLVRLTGRFPKLVYLLAFDRLRVEQALANNQADGRAYLEKIVQVGFDVPTVPRSLIRDMTVERLNESLADVTAGPFDERAWADLREDVILPLIETMRDVKRYAATASANVAAIGDRVALADVLALESIRLFLPDVFALLPKSIEALTAPSSREGDRTIEEGWKKQLQDMVDAGDDRAYIVRAAFRLLFPESRRGLNASFYAVHSGDSRRNRRVAYAPLLRYYLDHAVTPDVQSPVLAERVFTALSADESQARAVLAPLDAEELEAALQALEDYEGEFPKATTDPALAVVMEALPRLRADKRGPFDLPPDLVVTRVMLRILRGRSASDIDEATRRMLARDLPLASKVELIDMVGHRKNAGHGLISEDAWRGHAADLAYQIATADPERLAAERDPLRLLHWALHSTYVVQAQIRPLLDHVGVVEHLFRSAVGVQHSWGLGSRRVDASRTLPWESLVAVFGNEAAIADARRRLAHDVEPTDDMGEILALIDRYLAGHRPRGHEEADMDDEREND